jgi:hypothetical protein
MRRNRMNEKYKVEIPTLDIRDAEHFCKTYNTPRYDVEKKYAEFPCEEDYLIYEAGRNRIIERMKKYIEEKEIENIDLRKTIKKLGNSIKKLTTEYEEE